MRVPLFWLHDYCDPGIGLAELEHRLTMTGTKVEALHTHGVDGARALPRRARADRRRSTRTPTA